MRSAFRRSGAFTLVELLTVLAIIGLLVAILLPSLQTARAQAKAVQTRSFLKAIGDGLEMFKNENGSDRAFRATGGYPLSAAADDPTEPGQEDTIFGAHWLVRHLLGKDNKGFIPRRYVPRDLQDKDNAYKEQVKWYEPDAYNNTLLDRAGPYLPVDESTIVATKKLPGASEDENTALNEMEQPVLVDSFGYPVLYYAADAMVAIRPHAPIATFIKVSENIDCGPGIYNFGDNGMFTGQAMGTKEDPGTRLYKVWDFGTGEHPIRFFGETYPPTPPTGEGPLSGSRPTDRTTFTYYLLDKEVFETTAAQTSDVTRATMVPHRKDSYLLITAGRDGLYGTSDDVNNF